jgi:MFS family permease
LPTIARPRLAGLWRHPDFMKLWTAETISQFGSQVSFLAIPLVAVLLLNATPFEVALLGTIEFLPFILFTLPAGVWVDRLRRRPILIIGDIGRAISLLSIPIAYELHALTIVQLYVVGFVNGVLTVFFDVAWQSYLPALVEREHLVEGNAKLEISRSAAQIGGPGLGGVLIDLISAPLAVVADAISFIGSALFIFGIRKHEPHPLAEAKAAGTPQTSMRVEVVEGLRYVLGHPLIRPIAACTSTSNLFGNMMFAIYIVYVVRELGLQPATIGLIFGIGNIGALLAAWLSSRVPQWFGVGPTIIGAIAISAGGALLVPLAPKENPVPLLILSGALGIFGGVIYNVNQVSLRQAITPDRMLGRLNATMRFIVWGTIPIGSLIGGALATAIGLLPTIWIGALGGLLSIVPVLFSPVRSLKEIPALAEEPTAAVQADREPTRGAPTGIEEGRINVGQGPIPTVDEHEAR